MLKNDESEAAVGRQSMQKLHQGIKPAGRCANSNYAREEVVPLARFEVWHDGTAPL
jgi:hypothetical protein